MFSKLLKHEWKANSRLLMILSFCALGAGLVGAGILRGIVYIAKNSDTDAAISVLSLTGMSGLLVFIAIGLLVYALGVQFINLFRFYKNKFTDEGYLTFTLPVTPHQIFWSSYVNMVIWFLLSLLTVLASAGIIIFLGGGAEVSGLFERIQSYIGEIVDLWESIYANEKGYAAYLVLQWVAALLTPFLSYVMLMTSITIGCVVAKKHKILMTILMYYLIQMGISIAESILSAVPTIILGFTEEIYVYYATVAAIGLTLQLGVAVGGYFLSIRLMRHKLNLP